MINKKLSKESIDILRESLKVSEDSGSVELLSTVIFQNLLSKDDDLRNFLRTECGISVVSLLAEIEKEKETEKNSSLRSIPGLWSDCNTVISTDVSRIFRLSESESRLLGVPEVTPECFFLAFTKDFGIVNEVIKKYSDDIEELYKKVYKRFSVTLKEKTITSPWDDTFSKHNVFPKSNDEDDKDFFISIRGKDKSEYSDFDKQIIKNLENFIKDNSFINSLKKSNNNISNMKKSFGWNNDDEEGSSEGLEKTQENPSPYLKKYATFLNQEAREGKFDKVIGREDELQQLIQILCCRKKNSAAIIGEAGTGKSALVEHLAQEIVDGNVPEQLKNKEIYSLNVNSLVSGSMYRGQFEKKLEGVINEILEDENKILSIDELASIVGAGSSSNSNDMSSILKPYLTKNEFQIIGACDFGSFREIEKDSALRRRFQTVKIIEPTEEETKEILLSIKDKYEKFHSVTYSEEAIDACVQYSEKYLPDRHFPDKAIDFLDVSGSYVKLKNIKKDDPELNALKKEIEDAIKGKETCVVNQDYLKAEEYKNKQTELENKLCEAISKRSVSYEVKKEDVAAVISKVTGIEMTKITEDEMEKLRNLKKVLSEKVIGQDEAIDQVVKALQKSRLGLKDPSRPISMFMSGSTATGKTYLSKTLAKEYFGTEDAFLMIDMSQLGSKESSSSLKGADPGYVGYDNPPIFEEVRKMGRGVILFDEAEKASPAVFQTLLQVLDEGKTRLTNGFEVNFKNFIIIFTSNIGTKEIMKEDIGFNLGGSAKKRNQEIIMKAIKNFFRPEFINRIDHFITFNNLTEENLEKIAEIELSNPISRIKENGYKVKISKHVYEYLVSKADKSYGARNIKRLIDTEIIDPITDIILDNQEVEKTNISIEAENDKLDFELS